MKLHPYTALIRGLSRGASTGVVVAVVSSMSEGSFRAAGGTLAAVAVAVLLGIGYEFLYYRRYEYELTADTLDIASGVVSRRVREIPLRRIQNVDVSQNAIHRLLDVATLRIETAGGSTTEATLRYVGRRQAEQLQDALSERSDHLAGVGDREGVVETGELLFELDRIELALTSALSIDPGVSAIGSVVALVAEGFLPRSGIDATRPIETMRGLGPIEIVLGVSGILLVAWLFSVAVVFNRYAGFKLRRVEDELRYERGFLGSYTGTIPLEKVQTLSVTENPLKRRIGYATLSIETAGYAPGQSRSGAQTAVPLARLDRVFDLATEIDGVSIDGGDFRRPPRRARQRYLVRYTLVVGVLGAIAYAVNLATGWLGRWSLVLLGILFVPVGAHLAWINRGYVEAEDHFVTRAGFWRRQTRIVPYRRIQTIVDRRTIFQRRRNLASVTADTASTSSLRGGDAVAIDVDEGDARRLRSTLLRKLLVQKAGVDPPPDDSIGPQP
jgi:putative membrane protein